MAVLVFEQRDVDAVRVRCERAFRRDGAEVVVRMVDWPHCRAQMGVMLRMPSGWLHFVSVAAEDSDDVTLARNVVGALRKRINSTQKATT